MLTRLLAATAACLVAVSGLPQATAEPPAPWQQKVQPAVRDRLAAKGTSDVLVHFADRSDLAKASRIRNWDDRGAYVVDQLRKTANASQHDARVLLDDAHATYQAFWVSNAILVKGAPSELAHSLAAEPEVAELSEVTTYKAPAVEPAKAVRQAGAVEWGVANVHANQVWDELGTRGDGIVVASIDTGVQFDHPDLAERYRGRKADGTYDHDYNWYDPSQVCGSPAPCDNIGHGTHTMGTMAGGDASGTSIGVAPGARWIAAKGCEDEQRGCTLGALLAAGQWTLAPTRQDGSAPRPDLRPQIVNNSWGADNGPIEEDFYNDILDAWEASGIFATFSNGNFGTKGCDSGGSPADVGTAYGVGAYDVTNAIASFSSRGPGENGKVKPDISAPGVSVRSSVPGNGYAYYSGTSMAAPHVSGAVALMWSAAPALTGDLSATRELLAQTAVDAPDLSCGGTPELNNVFGEGRLDARAAVVASPRGQTGVLTGTVTDASGAPVRDAAVAAAGPDYHRETTTGADGRFRVAVVAGTYEISVTAYGFRPATVTGVAVGGGETVTRDIALAKVPMARVSGTVTDGSGHGWPLAATLTVHGVPDGVFHTDPATGRYSFSLPRENTYSVDVRATYPGYVAHQDQLVIGTRDVVAPFRLTADATECDAPGYRTTYQGLFESFDGGALPAGWTEAHELGDGWEFGDPGERGNLTGGSRAFASIDSAAGKLLEKGVLTTPAIDLRGQAAPVLAFRTDFPYRAGARGSVNAELSVDGGATWKTVWSRASILRGPYLVEVPLPDAAGVADVRVRFGYDSGWTYDGWWQVDDVLVGAKTCQALPGGLVVGHVTDDRTHEPIGDATVRSRSDASLTTTTDAAGFYWLFSPRTGRQAFTASNSYAQYDSRDRTVRVSAHRVTEADFALGTGRLRVSQAEIEREVRIGDRRTVSFTVKNTGTATATFQLTEHASDLDQAGQSALRAEGAAVQRFPTTDQGNRLPPAQQKAKTSVADPKAAEWTQLPSMTVENLDQVAAVHDGKLYAVGGASTQPNDQGHSVYDFATEQWSPIARTTVSREKPTGGFIDGKLYVVGGWSWDGETGTTQIYDPASDIWSFGADAPVKFAAAASVVLDGKLYVIGGRTDRDPERGSTHVLVYDPKADSWSRVADYPEPISWQSCGVIDGLVYCAGGQDGGEKHKRTAYAYSATVDRWFRIADLPATVWGAGYIAANDLLLVSGGVVDGYRSNQGFFYDPATDRWDTLPNSLFALYRVASACGFYKVGGSEGLYGNKPYVEQLPGFDRCDSAANRVPWLAAGARTWTLRPGQSTQVTVTLDARRVRRTGTYTARLLLHEDTPYPGVQLPVTMEVVRPPH
ncbi:S8 family serine peptidase [Flindersiella endophytica]